MRNLRCYLLKSYQLTPYTSLSAGLQFDSTFGLHNKWCQAITPTINSVDAIRIILSLCGHGVYHY